jgi:hypothetical protein
MNMLQLLLNTIQKLSTQCPEIPLEMICEKVNRKPEDLQGDIEHLISMGFITRSCHRSRVILTEQGKHANLPQ